MARSTVRIRYRRDTCLCGCGQKPRDGRLFWWGHRKRATRQQFEDCFHWLNGIAPLCACGCGTQTRCMYGSVDAWVDSGCLPFFRQYADGHENCTSNQLLELTTLERQAILGTLLGDSSITYPHKRSQAPRISSNHGLVQKCWAEHKSAFLHRLNASTCIAKNRGWGDNSVRTSTPCNPSLIEIHRLVTRCGKKYVSREWLDSIGDIGLAWWLCDDGSAGTKTLQLHTEGFSLEHNELIADWFCDNIGKTTVVNNRAKGLSFINFASWTQVEIGRRVSPYVPECMRYKLVPCDENRSRKSGGRVRHRSRNEPLFFCQQPAGS